MGDSESHYLCYIVARFYRLENFRTDLDKNLGHAYKM